MHIQNDLTVFEYKMHKGIMIHKNIVSSYIKIVNIFSTVNIVKNYLTALSFPSTISS